MLFIDPIGQGMLFQHERLIWVTRLYRPCRRVTESFRHAWLRALLRIRTRAGSECPIEEACTGLALRRWASDSLPTRSPPALALLCLTLLLPAPAGAISNPGFDNGSAAWNLTGDFSVETGTFGPAGDPKLVLTTNPGSHASLGSGAIGPAAITALLGISAMELANHDSDSTPGGFDAFEGSGAIQQFVVGFNATLTFDWQLFTDETTFSSPFPDFVLFHVRNLGGTFSVIQLVTDVLTESVVGNLSASGTTYDSESGVNSFSVPLNGPGTYILGIAIFDVTDNLFDNAVAIDNVSLVPEPSGVALAAGALLALSVVRRCGRRPSRAAR